MSYDLMPDATHDAVKNVPPNGPFTHVAGYVSGTPGILWTETDWARFPKQIHIRIEQGYGTLTPELSSYDVLDIERGAWTPETAANEVKRRVEAGYQWTTLYATDADLASTGALIRAMGDHIWVGHVDCVLADWNDNVDEAFKTVGTEVHGMTCRGVQWASPTSNPHTLLPGTAMTLQEANVDLNVVQPGWNPPTVPVAPVKPPVVVPPTPVPPVSAPPSAELSGIVVYTEGSIMSKAVKSADGGLTWR